MKKILLAFLMLVLVSGCSCKNSSPEDNNKINVVCTVFPQYDFVREIAKDKVNLTMLLPPGTEAHSYEPSPGDIIALKEADLFIAIGGESEHWALHLLESEELKNTNTLLLLNAVNTLNEEHKVGMDDVNHGHSHVHDTNCNHHDEEYDEHIWTSPENAIIMCNKICDALIKADRKNASFYLDNLNTYIKKLKKLNAEFTSLAKKAKRNTIVVGDRFPLRYLTEEISLDYYAAFPGCSSKSEPSVNTVIYLCNKAKEEKIPVIFSVDYSDGRIAKTIAEANNAKCMRLYSCHNLSKDQFKNGETYISLMKKNHSALKEALN